MADLSQEEWTKQLEADDNAVVLDVRTQDEIDLGMIPNAIHIDIFKGQGFIHEVEQLDKTKTITCTVSLVIEADKLVQL
ncbi:Protein containing rhodanese-like protein [Winogradskyella psychrotolerans RS-3]|uniref:Protein containing rhodanese-like protein n=1 Tax=Winogradskyella psychrotolerans RS-3 TaxID=641526 RepID=S7VUF2_9FLAO|nr:Protein containing rhodanese-like protein [Winogradskyella psychrotolerans RS-3]